MSGRNTSPELLAIKRTSLVTETAEHLRRALAARRWTDTLPGERTLAELMKISRPTLRAALQILVREGVLSVSARRKYRVQTRGEKRLVHTSGRVVLLSPYTLQELEIRIPPTITWIDHLRERLLRAQLEFEVVCRPSCYSGRPQKALELLARENTPDCWLLYRSTPAMRQWFIRRQQRHLVLGSVNQTEESSSVDLDYDATCRHAVGLFARAGHRAVALVQLKTGLPGDESSRETFLKACRERQPEPLTPFLLEHDGTREGACRAVDHLLQFNPRPTAILSAYPQQTISVFSRLIERGYRIPGDMSLISRDYHPTFDFLSPSLAYYKWSYRNYASKVFQTIQSILHHPLGYVIHARILPEFVNGVSLGLPLEVGSSRHK